MRRSNSEGAAQALQRDFKIEEVAKSMDGERTHHYTKESYTKKYSDY